MVSEQSSCESALLVALNSWMGEIDEGKLVGALLIDLSKAFDTVPHQRLLDELEQIGCGCSALHLFHSYLSDREQRVKQGSEMTAWRDVTRGVPQGSCLSPLLFNIYVRQLPSNSDSETFQFADDITHSESNKSEIAVTYKLEDAFRATKDFCVEHDLVINTNKTQFIIFKSPNRRLVEGLEILLDDCLIKPSDHVKLLGVTLDQHLTFGAHIESTVKTCNGILGQLRRAAPHMPRELLRAAYISLIRSHLEYCSAAFASASKTQLNKLNIVQKIASRVICRAPRNSHSAPLLDSLQLESLESRRIAHVAKIVRAALKGETHPALHVYSQ